MNEVCAVKIKIGNRLVILLCTHRSPSVNFGEFAVQLDLILKFLYKPKLEYIICSDFNVNFLIDSSSAQQLSANGLDYVVSGVIVHRNVTRGERVRMVLPPPNGRNQEEEKRAAKL